MNKKCKHIESTKQSRCIEDRPVIKCSDMRQQHAARAFFLLFATFCLLSCIFYALLAKALQCLLIYAHHLNTISGALNDTHTHTHTEFADVCKHMTKYLSASATNWLTLLSARHGSLSSAEHVTYVSATSLK